MGEVACQGIAPGWDAPFHLPENMRCEEALEMPNHF